jgi:hypothetical protein
MRRQAKHWSTVPT